MQLCCHRIFSRSFQLLHFWSWLSIFILTPQASFFKPASYYSLKNWSSWTRTSSNSCYYATHVTSLLLSWWTICAKANGHVLVIILLDLATACWHSWHPLLLEICFLLKNQGTAKPGFIFSFTDCYHLVFFAGSCSSSQYYLDFPIYVHSSGVLSQLHHNTLTTICLVTNQKCARPTQNWSACLNCILFISNPTYEVTISFFLI